jgi:hypothetical protein
MDDLTCTRNHTIDFKDQHITPYGLTLSTRELRAQGGVTTVFNMPIIVVKVAPGGQGEHNGVRVGDTIVQVKPRGGAMIESLLTDGDYARQTMSDVLWAGGDCTIVFQRAHRKVCSGCLRYNMIQVEDGYVCDDCGLTEQNSVTWGGNTACDWTRSGCPSRPEVASVTETVILGNPPPKHNAKIPKLGSVEGLRKSQNYIAPELMMHFDGPHCRSLHKELCQRLMAGQDEFHMASNLKLNTVMRATYPKKLPKYMQYNEMLPFAVFVTTCEQLRCPLNVSEVFEMALVNNPKIDFHEPKEGVKILMRCVSVVKKVMRAQDTLKIATARSVAPS